MYLHSYLHIYGIHTYRCMFIRIYVYTYIHTYVYTYVYICTFIYTYMCTYIHLYNIRNTYIRKYERTYVCTYVNTFVQTYIHSYIYTYICTYIYSIYVCMHNEYVHMYVRIFNIAYFCEPPNLLWSFSLASASSLNLTALLLYTTDLLIVHYYCIQFPILMYLKFMVRHVTLRFYILWSNIRIIL